MKVERKSCATSKIYIIRLYLVLLVVIGSDLIYYL